jgi:hypothetical protein
VHSFDYDPHSVAATTKLRTSTNSPPQWKVEHGSILDKNYVRSLGQFDIVYSWGVLHHTGAMWDAGNVFEEILPVFAERERNVLSTQAPHPS